MYLQITTRCNMKCDHCCYSCRPGAGKHMDYHTALDAVRFIKEYNGGEHIALGGGEPTLHPRFFDILKFTMWNFSSVWMASNGKRTKSMIRLANIIECEDYLTEGIDVDYDYIASEEDQLSVALSQDMFHDPIDEGIVNLWKSRNYKIRDVTAYGDPPLAVGRAKRTGTGYEDGCVCGDLFIKPDGDIKACGCLKAPIVGNIRYGINEEWQSLLNDDEKYQYNRCGRHLKL